MTHYLVTGINDLTFEEGSHIVKIRIDNVKGCYSLLLLPITLRYFLSVVWLFLTRSVILRLLGA